ncbi:unnamed protein product [Rodentolepis nana]|uniref:Large ribosomal subunit protein eL31 n=1 Tax=Rodentolepis nana TaxID=102285 RepID=A0A158QIU7_RODNA|nr:unnamed protein product [Rodentolepis nana]
MARTQKVKRAVRKDAVTREYTIHLHKRIHGVGFKKRAPRALQEIRKFARKMMGTEDVRVNVRLNEFIWSKGVRNVPYRVRVKLARKRNEDEDSPHKFYTLVSYVPCADFKGKQNINSIDRMPWLVRRHIVDCLDYASWFQLQSVFSRYKSHPPTHLKFDSSYAYENVWSSTKLSRNVRISRITEDEFYGGIVKPTGSIGVLLQMLKFSPRSFHSLTVLDISYQIINRHQVSELFSSSTASIFCQVKSVSLRISLESASDVRGPNLAFSPPNLENLTLNLMHWRSNDFSDIDSLVPLIINARKLSFILDLPSDLLTFFDGQGPFENVVELEATDHNLSLIRSIYTRFNENFPRLKKIVIKNCCIERTFEIYPEYYASISTKPVVWCSSAASRFREFDSVRDILFFGDEVVDVSTLHKCVNATVFTWFMRGWSCFWHDFLRNIHILRPLRRLNEFKLPQQMFTAWSEFDSFRFECRKFTRTFWTFPSVQSLHFIPANRRVVVSDFRAPAFPHGEKADELLRHMFDIFPNVKTLSIAPVPLLEGGEVFRYLTTSTKLTALMILYTKRIQHGSLDGRLKFYMWLPATKTLDAFLFYTDQVFWINETDGMGLLDCLKKNTSLRYACIICDVPKCLGRIGLTGKVVEEIGSTWYNEQKGGSQGRYLLFVFRHHGRFSCLAVKPRTKKCRKSYTFERNSFSTWHGLECAYPELYSVFWRHLRHHINFRYLLGVTGVVGSAALILYLSPQVRDYVTQTVPQLKPYIDGMNKALDDWKMNSSSLTSFEFPTKKVSVSPEDTGVGPTFPSTSDAMRIVGDVKQSIKDIESEIHLAIAHTEKAVSDALADLRALHTVTGRQLNDQQDALGKLELPSFLRDKVGAAERKAKESHQNAQRQLAKLRALLDSAKENMSEKEKELVKSAIVRYSDLAYDLAGLVTEVRRLQNQSSVYLNLANADNEVKVALQDKLNAILPKSLSNLRKEDGSEMTLEEVNSLLAMSLERIDKLQESLKTSGETAKQHIAAAIQKYKMEADRIAQEAVDRAIHREQVKRELERFEWLVISNATMVALVAKL